jgi:hypothetical protein
VRIDPVGVEALDDFIALGYRLGAAADARFVPPLRQQLMFELAGMSELAKYADQQLFLARADDGRVVGRVAAIVNRKLHDASGAPLGQLGYFECEDDVAVATALFDAGAAWLRARGCKELLAPMNGGAHRLHRLMVRGFEREPFLFEPRNPPYYPRLFEAWGMHVAHRWFSYELERARLADLQRRFARVVDGRPMPGSYTALAPRDPSPLPRLHALLDDFWNGHVGYASLSLAEFGEAFDGALAVMTHRNIILYLEGERDLGIAFMYPDHVDEARKLAGDASRWGHWMDRPMPKRMIMHTLALRPEVRTTPVPLALMEAGFLYLLDQGYESLVVALVVEGLLGKQLGEPTREYALYGKAL